jgi:hypothetical protein
MARGRKILVLRNEAEAQLLDAILTERDIPHFMKSYHDSAYDGIWQSQLGWGHVEAPAEYQDEIEAIYADLGAGEHPDESSGEEPVP